MCAHYTPGSSNSQKKAIAGINRGLASATKGINRGLASATKESSVNTDALDVDVSSGSASRKFQMTKQTKLLIQRQKAELPAALKALKKHRRKIGHWAWW